MNNPEIWTIKMADHPQDDFVRLSAYKALDLHKAELMVENARLKAEVERLRKAGDAMLLALWLGVNEYSKEQKEKAEEEWNAANREQGCLVNPIKVAQYLPKPPTKEGKQP